MRDRIYCETGRQTSSFLGGAGGVHPEKSGTPLCDRCGWQDQRRGGDDVSDSRCVFPQNPAARFAETRRIRGGTAVFASKPRRCGVLFAKVQANDRSRGVHLHRRTRRAGSSGMFGGTGGENRSRFQTGLHFSRRVVGKRIRPPAVPDPPQCGKIRQSRAGQGYVVFLRLQPVVAHDCLQRLGRRFATVVFLHGFKRRIVFRFVLHRPFALQHEHPADMADGATVPLRRP